MPINAILCWTIQSHFRHIFNAALARLLGTFQSVRVPSCFLCLGAIKRKRHSLTSLHCPLSVPGTPYKSINLNCQAAVKLCCYRERFSLRFDSPGIATDRFGTARVRRGLGLFCFAWVRVLEVREERVASGERDFGYGDMSRFTEWLTTSCVIKYR